MGVGGKWGGRLFEAGRLLTFSAFRMGAYSRWALIRGWALIRINTVVDRSYHYITSRLWNNLPDYVRRAPSLNTFKSMLDEANLTIGVECNCNFCA